LKKQNPLTQELSVIALNTGISPNEISRLSREALQAKVTERIETGQYAPLMDYEIEDMILEESQFEFDRPAITLIGGMGYRNMAEKLVASMACGPDASSNDLVQDGIGGFSVPMFYPPRIISRNAPARPCGRPRSQASMNVSANQSLID